jgi:hypothetical protein
VRAGRQHHQEQVGGAGARDGGRLHVQEGGEEADVGQQPGEGEPRGGPGASAPGRGGHQRAQQHQHQLHRRVQVGALHGEEQAPEGADQQHQHAGRQQDAARALPAPLLQRVLEPAGRTGAWLLHPCRPSGLQASLLPRHRRRIKTA